MKHILVVDDSLANCFVIEMMMPKLGYNVTSITDSTQVIEQLKTHNYCAILLDISMPKLNGDELCKMIKDTYHPRHYGLIFAYTAHVLDKSDEIITSSKFDDVLIKPVTQEKIEALLTKHKMLK